MNTCRGCKEEKDCAMKYTKCKECGGWRELNAEEKAKIACLNDDGSINRSKWGEYQKSLRG